MLALISDTGIAVAIIAFVALFGASHIPKLARNLGEAGKEFRRAHAEFETSPSPTAPSPAAEISAAPAAPAPLTASEDRITLTKAQFDELLARPAIPAEPRS